MAEYIKEEATDFIDLTDIKDEPLDLLDIERNFEEMEDCHNDIERKCSVTENCHEEMEFITMAGTQVKCSVTEKCHEEMEFITLADSGSIYHSELESETVANCSSGDVGSSNKTVSNGKRKRTSRESDSEDEDSDGLSGLFSDEDDDCDDDGDDDEDDGSHHGGKGDDSSWGRDPSSMGFFVFKSENKLLTQISGQDRTIDWFNLLLRDEFLKSIVDETNKAVNTTLSDPNFNPTSRIRKWTPLTVPELRVLIGLLYYMGTVKCSKLQHYWKTEEMFDFSYVRTRMSRVRFLHIMGFLSFPYRGEDKCSGEIAQMVEWFNRLMDRVYYPDKVLVLDEGLSFFKGRPEFKKRSNEKGFRLFNLREPTGPVLRLAVRDKKDRSKGVAKELMAGKHEGHSVSVNYDHFCISDARDLFEINTHCTGYLQKKSFDIPSELKSSKIRLGFTQARYSEGVMIGKWRQKTGDVYYASSEYKNVLTFDPKLKGGKKNSLEIPVPVLKLRYSRNALSAESTDPLMDFYPEFNQKFYSQSKKFFIHLLQVLMFNAFKLFSFYNMKTGRGSHYDIHEFRTSVIRELMGHKKSRFKAVPLMDVAVDEPVHRLAKLPVSEVDSKQQGRRRCKQCMSEGVKERKSMYYCAQCPGAPGFCPPCFEKYHVARALMMNTLIKKNKPQQ